MPVTGGEHEHFGDLSECGIEDLRTVGLQRKGKEERAWGVGSPITMVNFHLVNPGH